MASESMSVIRYPEEDGGGMQVDDRQPRRSIDQIPTESDTPALVLRVLDLRQSNDEDRARDSPGSSMSMMRVRVVSLNHHLLTVLICPNWST